MAQARPDRRHHPLRRDRRGGALDRVHRHRQAHAVPPVAPARRGEERGARDRRGRDVHRAGHDHRRRDPRLMGLRSGEADAAIAPRVGPGELALLASVFVVAACGLVYELCAGALASYLLGDSVLQFSTVIGTYLFAMGLGSWASRHVREQLATMFVRVELIVGVIGGLMPAALFAAHATLPAASLISFKVLLYGLVTIVGIGVGLEIPIVLRLLDRHLKGRDSLSMLVSQVLTFDYLGSLVVSVAFPLLLVPHLGIVRSGVFFGLLNTLVAIWSLWLFRGDIPRWRALAAQCGAIFALLVAAMAMG